MNDGSIIAAIAMLIATIPCGIVVLRAQLMSAVVAYEAISSIIVMVLVLLAEGFGRPGGVGLPVLLAVLLFGSGLVFVRFLERWLRPYATCWRTCCSAWPWRSCSPPRSACW